MVISARAGDPAYRADIDGLRAIAVLVVVIFHLYVGLLPAGFLGVDVFFVISGFLITRILDRECLAGTFSIWRFYDRRIRRIIPALIFMLAVTTAACCAIFLPADLIGFAKSQISTFSFVSNVYFWRDTNYFSESAMTKPLLHTWSLSIEEQFYIFFPFLLYFITKLPNRYLTIAIVAALTAASFALAFFMYDINRGIVAFYLLPMRAWELGVGATIALGSFSLPGKWLQTLIAALSLALLIWSCCLIDPAVFLPVPPATLPVLATGLLIWVGSLGNVVSSMIGWKPMVWVGNISYSLYLWHWPVYVIVRYVLVREPTRLESTALLAVSLIAAIVSWRFVEKPFRSGNMSTRRVLGITGAGAALLIAISVSLIVLGGLPARFSGDAAAFNRVGGTLYRCPVNAIIPFERSYACPINLPSNQPADAEVILFGNSHALMYVPAVEAALVRLHRTGALVTANRCLPTASLNVSSQCLAIARANISAASELKGARVIVIAFSWPEPQTPMVRAGHEARRPVSPDEFIQSLNETIATFESAGKSVVMVGPIPRPGYDISSQISREVAFHGSARSPLEESRTLYNQRFGRFEGWLGEPGHDWTVVKPSHLFCNPERCSYLLGGQLVFTDGSHLSGNALQPFEGPFEAAIAQALGQGAPPA